MPKITQTGSNLRINNEEDIKKSIWQDIQQRINSRTGKINNQGQQNREIITCTKKEVMKDSEKLRKEWEKSRKTKKR